MNRITKRLDDLAKLPSVLDELKERLCYQAELGFTAEESNGYAQQLDDIKEILIPAWAERLHDTQYEILVDCSPKRGGFIKIKVLRGESKPVEVFAESYSSFNAEMCDGSCYQYVYQKVVCFKEGLHSGRVPL